MKRFIFLAFLLVTWATCASALAATPESALSAILKSDFRGDTTTRIGKAIFTDGKGDKRGHDCCAYPREKFHLEKDRLVIVSSWKLRKTIGATKSSAVIKVDYCVIAETNNSGEANVYRPEARTITLSTPPRTETIAYHLEKKGDDWVIVDPPLPRVSAELVLSKMEETLRQRMERLSTLLPTTDNYESRKQSLQNAIKGYERQIEALKEAGG